MLTKEQSERYSRQFILPQIGISGQQRLLESRVLVIGAGGLGAPVLAYLATAGIGTIGIVDGDVVDMSNLQRQFIHHENDVGTSKVASAAEFIRQSNSNILVIEHPDYLTPENAKQIITNYDLVINGTDNFPTRYLVNDCCVLLQKPLVDASILKFEGQTSVFLPGNGCYRCLYPVAPRASLVPSCSEVGVIGPIAGVMGSLQAVEAIKVLLDIGKPLAGKLVLFDLLAGSFRSIVWKRNPNCPVCGNEPTIRDLNGDYGVTCSTAQGENTEEWDIDFDTLFQLYETAEIYDLRDHMERIGLPEIPHSKRMVYEEVLDESGSWDMDRPLVFVCSIGIRSGALTEILRLQGFTNVFHLRGGMTAWLPQLEDAFSFRGGERS